jgi:thiamine biosynthesis lipoprotein
MKNTKLLICVIAGATALSTLFSCSHGKIYKSADGFTQGTTYHIIYEYDRADSLNGLIDSLLTAIDNSMSVYNPNSLISSFNNGNDIVPDSLFAEVFRKSAEITKISKGAFDVSGGPLFDAWGFGSKEKRVCTKETVDSLLKLVGMDKVAFENGKIVRRVPGVELNFNAIAQGYTSDVIARAFDRLGIQNYLIEVGGEIYCKGKSSRGDMWSVGIDKPVEGNEIPGEDLESVLQLSDKGLATSGNYRKFIEENGEKYSHTIDPRTGYPVKNTLLSATVVAKDAMTADALATYFMVVGMEETKEFLSSNKDIDAFLVYSEGGVFKTYKTPGIKLK